MFFSVILMFFSCFYQIIMCLPCFSWQPWKTSNGRGLGRIMGCVGRSVGGLVVVEVGWEGEGLRRMEGVGQSVKGVWRGMGGAGVDRRGCAEGGKSCSPR